MVSFIYFLIWSWTKVQKEPKARKHIKLLSWDLLGHVSDWPQLSWLKEVFLLVYLVRHPSETSTVTAGSGFCFPAVRKVCFLHSFVHSCVCMCASMCTGTLHARCHDTHLEIRGQLAVGSWYLGLSS